jgi:hypothetical protein
VNEQSTLSRYFDLHPSARRSFLQAVQGVAGHEYGITPAATPTRSVDELPVAADRISSIGYEIHNRAYDKTAPIPDTLDPRTAFDLGINTIPHGDYMYQNAQQYCSPLYTFASEVTQPGPGEHMDISGQRVVGEPLEQTGQDTYIKVASPFLPPTNLHRVRRAGNKPLPASTLLTTTHSIGPPSDAQSSQVDPDSLLYAQQPCPAHDIAGPEQQLPSRVDAVPVVPPDT